MRLVVKIGGSVLSEGLEGLIGDLKGMKGVVLVHGGGREVTEVAKRMGKEQKYIVSPSGIRSRYTDLGTLEIFVMVMAGKISTEIVAQLQSIGISAIGLSGVDACLIKAERKKTRLPSIVLLPKSLCFPNLKPIRVESESEHKHLHILRKLTGTGWKEHKRGVRFRR